MPIKDQHQRSGQAIVEFVMVIIAIMLLVAAATELLPLFIESVQQQNSAHKEAGKTALQSDEGTVVGHPEAYKATLSLPLLLDDAEINISTKVKFPAANLFARDELYPIPDNFGGATLVNNSQKGKSKFMAWFVSAKPEVLKSAASSLLPDGGWTPCHDLAYENDNTHEYVYIYTKGDLASPTFVAAIYVGPAYTDENPEHPTTSTVIVIARTAGASETIGD